MGEVVGLWRGWPIGGEYGEAHFEFECTGDSDDGVEVWMAVSGFHLCDPRAGDASLLGEFCLAQAVGDASFLEQGGDAGDGGGWSCGGHVVPVYAREPIVPVYARKHLIHVYEHEQEEREGAPVEQVAQGHIAGAAFRAE